MGWVIYGVVIDGMGMWELLSLARGVGVCVCVWGGPCQVNSKGC